MSLKLYIDDISLGVLVNEGLNSINVENLKNCEEIFFRRRIFINLFRGNCDKDIWLCYDFLTFSNGVDIQFLILDIQLNHAECHLLLASDELYLD